jgi:RNA-binding protein
VLESASFEKQRIQAPRVKQMALSNADKKRFRTIGHSLKPVVTVAQKGFTENIKSEIERALKQHELIKIKLVIEDKDEKKRAAESICDEFKAQCLQSTGNILLIYRAAKKQDPRLSNVKRKVL